MELVDSLRIYNSSSESLLSKHQGLAGTAKYLVSLVRSGLLSFPYRKFFGPSAEKLWSELLTSQPITSTQDYEMLSYYPKYKSYLPPRLEPSLNIPHDMESVLPPGPIPFAISDEPSKVSYLTDYYLEDLRLKARRYDTDLSVHDVWFTQSTESDNLLTQIWMRSLQSPTLTMEVVRNASASVVAETKSFALMWVKGLINKFVPNPSGKKYLDISAGWGDRLLVAEALDMEYLGFDPNLELKPRHDEMIRDHGNPKYHKVIYVGFETAELAPEYYDLMISSPPFFNLEIYSQHGGQSIVKYSDESSWMVHFLFRSLKLAWDALKIGGLLCLHLGDAPTIRSAEPANFYIETLPGAYWLGALGVYSKSGRRPVWCWRKEIPGQGRVWNALANHKLGFTYPVYAGELINSRLASPEVEMSKERCNGFSGLDPLLVYSISQKAWPHWSLIAKRALARKITDQVLAQLEGRDLSFKSKTPNLFSPTVWYQLMLELNSREAALQFADLTNKQSSNYYQRVANWKLILSRYPGGKFDPVSITVTAELKGWNYVSLVLNELYN